VGEVAYVKIRAIAEDFTVSFFYFSIGHIKIIATQHFALRQVIRVNRNPVDCIEGFGD
jgi:hypothetical protein